MAILWTGVALAQTQGSATPQSAATAAASNRDAGANGMQQRSKPKPAPGSAPNQALLEYLGSYTDAVDGHDPLEFDNDDAELLGLESGNEKNAKGPISAAASHR